MFKPTIFIGSTVEHKHFAQAIQVQIQYETHPIVWTQGTFKPSHFPLESLEDVLDNADFAILICAPSDLTNIRGKEYSTVRDNIIFELGLFIGKLSRKRTFLISPRGIDLHLPSDLDGLTPETYDPDQVANIEAALGPACTKILRIVEELGPLPRSTKKTDLEGSTRIATVSPQESELDRDRSSNWTVEDFEWAYFFAAHEGNSLKAQEIETAFESSETAKSLEAMSIWTAWKEIVGMYAGKHTNIDIIRKQIALFPNSDRLRIFLGQALSYYSDEKGAAEAFTTAINLASDIKSLGRAIRLASTAETITNDNSQIRMMRNKLLELKESPASDKKDIVKLMIDIAKASTLKNIALCISEAEVALAPENTDARFELARQYAEIDQNILALHHYESIPAQERSGVAWNNLGVSYARLNMNAKAVDAYEAAAEKNETIAQGNLAQKFLSVGFVNKAQELVDLAIAKPGYHESIVGILDSIRTSKATEEDLLKSAKLEASSAKKIWLDIGLSAVEAEGPNISGTWSTPDGIIELEDKGSGIYSGTGTIVKNVESQGIGGFFIQKEDETRRLDIKIRRFGNALEGTLIWEPSQNPVTLLGTITSERTLLLKIATDGEEISGLEIGYETKGIIWTKQIPIDANL